ncbi:hypothetical protein F5884DRAFT_903936 [Xylogone sp. PMI_703]|nr:hypothetical protein F5884DRAFT_903936 [Xylogone sp. PMI_703]
MGCRCLFTSVEHSLNQHQQFCTHPVPTNIIEMKQTCLCKYLGLVCNHPDTFLHLPASVRRRIYQYAGLVTDAYIELPTIDEDSGFTVNILQVCRQIRDEVEGIILAQNTLFVSQDNLEDGLLYLGGLSSYACSQLRNLYVHLRWDGRYNSWSIIPPLKWDCIELWEWAAMHILSHASPRQLRLHLICDIEDNNMNKINAVLRPLRAFPGLLLELELRVAYQKHQHLSALVYETVLLAESPDANVRSDYFRFLDLPKEIRAHIFSYTNLVTPYRKVQWTPKRGFSISFPFCECDGDVCCEEDLHLGHKFFRCDVQSRITGDFCSGNYSAYSSHCNHSFSILPLLLVSREIYNQAIAFFYSNNRITILPAYSPEHAVFAMADAETSTPRQNDSTEFSLTEYIKHDTTKLFLEKLRPEVIRHLRTLEVVFPRINPMSDTLHRSLAYNEWCLAVNHLVVHADVPKLTLAIYISTTERDRTKIWMHGIIASNFSMQSHHLLFPLQNLSHMKRLFVHLEWLRHWSPPKLLNDIKTFPLPKKDSPGCDIGFHFIPDSAKHAIEEEIVLEKMIMGPEYESNSLGKGDELPGAWLRSAWDSMM